MIITTVDTISGMTIKRTIGIVRGNTIRARNIVHDILAVLKNIVGGEISDLRVGGSAGGRR